MTGRNDTWITIHKEMVETVLEIALHTRDVWKDCLIASSHIVDAEEREQCRETLIEPDVIPPFHGDQVPKPLFSSVRTPASFKKKSPWNQIVLGLLGSLPGVRSHGR
jgi:hypothetical protein